MNVTEKIITESISNSTDRPTLLNIHKRTISKVHEALVSTQETYKPTATVYGAKYTYDDEAGTEVISAGSYTGKYTYNEVQALPDYDPAGTYAKGDVFKIENRAIEVISDDFTASAIAAGEEDEFVFDGIIANQLRIVTDADSTENYSDAERELQELGFKFERWQTNVKTRKAVSRFSIELLQDMESNHLDPEDVINGLLSTVVAEDVNRDIIAKLNTISTKSNTALDVSQLDTRGAARKILADISMAAAGITQRTTFQASFVVASAKVVGTLQSLDSVETKTIEGRKRFFFVSSGIELIIDRYALFDYYMVGAKGETDEGYVTPLYFSPYNVSGTGGMTTVQFGTLGSKNMQPVAIITTRYGLCTSPFAKANDNSSVIDGEDWAGLAGKSQLVLMRKVNLPEESEPVE